MKMLISLALTLCLLASFAACSNDSADTTTADKDTIAVTEAVTDAVTEEVTDTAEGAVTDIVTDLVTDVVTDVVTDIVTEAETEAITDKITDAVTDGVTDAVTDADTDAVTEAPAKPDDISEDIIGIWLTTLDFSDVLNSSFAASAPGITLPKIESFAIEALLDIKKDGTYTMLISENVVNSSIENIKPAMKLTIKALYEALADQNNMTLEELLTASNTTLDESVDQIAASLSEIATEFTSKYEVKGDKLYTESDGNGNIDKTQYIKYTLKDNTLTFTDMVISDESSMVVLESVLPVVFEKLIILTPIIS